MKKYDQCASRLELRGSTNMFAKIMIDSVISCQNQYTAVVYAPLRGEPGCGIQEGFPRLNHW